MPTRSRWRQAVAVVVLAATVLPAIALVNGIPAITSPLYWLAVGGATVAQAVGGYVS
jgi:hypothetical protein